MNIGAKNKLVSLYVEASSKKDGGVRVVPVGAKRYRVQAGVGEPIDGIPVEVGYITHVDEQGKPLAWHVTSDEATRLEAISALIESGVDATVAGVKDACREVLNLYREHGLDRCKRVSWVVRSGENGHVYGLTRDLLDSYTLAYQTAALSLIDDLVSFN